MSDAHNILVGEPDRKRTLRRSVHTSDDNIKTDLKEVDFEEVDRTQPVQDRV
jgi:hypothetical protein